MAVTEQRVTERLSGPTESLFHTLVDHAPVMVWMAGTDTLCIFFNKPWMDFTGRTVEQELGTGWTEGVHPDDRQRCLDTYLSSFAVRSPFTMEYRLRRADGEYRWLLDNGVPFDDADGNFAGYIGSCIDITERKRAQRMRDEVLSLVFHDVRSPLGAISMSASFLLDVPLPKEQRSTHLRIIQRAAHRMNRLIQNLLDVARIESGQALSLQLDVRQVGELIDDACAIIRPAAVEKGIDLICRTSANLPPVLADRNRIVQVLSNLLDNAIRFTPEGGRIILRAERMNGDVRMSVADTGPGIPHLAGLFDPYGQAAVPGLRESPGFGLMISKAIMEAHGGRIWAESTPTGAEFFVTLPAHNADRTHRD